MRPAGSEKHKINLAWPTTDNTLVTTDNPRDTTDSAIQVYNLAGKIELQYIINTCRQAVTYVFSRKFPSSPALVLELVVVVVKKVVSSDSLWVILHGLGSLSSHR